ncbi:ATP-dependent Clp protease proteolytic subunit [Ulvibacterium sp.]|uniref:SDH family Clp fold serine proteinase n=1 Tax=Ulvibacterium sp. TaxID=2665914 RepID=UPI00262EC09B|nr:ATP-dependent Clp protease proteolytic subunit [Ulvibacterium sp.]
MEGYTGLFWIFIIISALQPVITRQLLNNSRKNLIEKIERDQKSKVIALIHRQESMALLGFPLVKYINLEDSEEVLRAIGTTNPEDSIDFVLHTPGGLVLAAMQIARAIEQHPGRIRVIVPHYAMSGGTLISLAADEIIMSPHAVLGPVDPQLANMPAPSLVKLKKEKSIDHIDDKTLVLADMAEKSIDQLKSGIKELMTHNYGEEKAEEISKMLTEGRWTHDYAITANFAKEIGLKVSTDISKDVLNLLQMYKQPTKLAVPTVDYLRKESS